jgi:hypothetical protein
VLHTPPKKYLCRRDTVPTCKLLDDILLQCFLPSQGAVTLDLDVVILAELYERDQIGRVQEWMKFDLIHLGKCSGQPLKDLEMRNLKVAYSYMLAFTLHLQLA